MRTIGVGLALIGLLVACTTGGHNQPAAVASPAPVPSPDPIAQKYTDLAKAFWDSYLAAEQNAGDVCLRDVKTTVCAQRAEAMVPVLQKFLDDLDLTRPPQKFAADDQNFRTQLPTAIGDLKDAIAAVKARNNAAFNQDIAKYVADMVPTVTGSLDHVDPSVTHT